MRALTRKERLTGQVGISLLAGMFSMVPAAFGMPVADTTHANNPTSMITTGANSMDVTGGNGTGGHYVAAWTDFSVAQGEKVTFDHGDIGKNDYLNLVTGHATSEIAGTIKGGNNVYLVNPHGVIFADGAEVNVGNLYVSTQDTLPGTAEINGFKTSGTSPIATSPTGDAANVVNLGTIKADKLTIVGNNVSLQDSAKIYKSNSNTVNTNVTIQAAGYIHVGHDAPGPWTDAATTQDANTAQYTRNQTITNYQLVDDVTDLGNMTTGGNYMLAKNVSGGTLSHQNITKSNPFTGNFDGMYHEIQNVAMTGGLFPAAQNANIENVGVVGSSVTPGSYDVPYDTNMPPSAVSAAGAIVGYATGTNRLHNVYSENVTMQDSSAINGGLVGIAGVGTLSISESYNTSQVKGNGQQYNRLGQTGNNYGGGIVGYVVGEKGSANGHATVNLTDVYNTGTTDYGMVGGIANVAGLVGVNVETSYSTNAGQGTLGPTGLVADSYSGIKTSKAVEDYNGFDISNKGGAGKKWRIYEGQTTPLLTAFFKGTATVDVNKSNVKSDTQVYNGTSGAYVTSKTPASTMTYSNGNVSKVYDGREINTSITKSDLSGNAQSDFGTNVKVAQSRKGDTATGVDKNVGNHTLVYSLQHGYDIVGGNAEITKRSLKIEKNMFFSKVYDGDTKITGTATNLFTATAGDTGLVDGDDVDLPGNIEGMFYDSEQSKVPTADAGVDRYVELKFDSAFTGNLTGTSAGNYDFPAPTGLTQDPTDPSKQILTSVKGIVMPRELVVTLRKSDDIDKTYDGTDAVLEKDAQGNTTAATKPYEAELYDATNGTGGNIVFDDHVAQNISADSTGYIDSQHKQALQLQFNPADPTYRDASGTANANASTTKNDRYIDYTGLKLASTSSNPNLINNYYLGDGNGNVLFYAGNDLTATDGNGNSQTFIKQTNASDGGTLTATGTIERRFIDATGITVTGAPTSKTYDGDSRVKDNGSDSLSVAAAVNAGTAKILAADAGKMTFTAVSGDFLNSGGTVEANATDYNGQGTGAQKVSYNVQVSAATDPSVLNNYTFVNKAALQNSTGDATVDLTALDAGTTYLGRDLQGGLVQTGNGIGIDKRVVDVSLDTAVAKNIDKPYDSYTTINATTAPGYADYVSYGSDSVLDADLINGSVTKAVYAEYTDPNVQRDANRNVLQEQNQVAYTVGLAGNGAGNYQVRDVAVSGSAAVNANQTNGNGVGVTLAAKGTGTIRPITLSVGSVSKVYDATDSVANAAIDIGGVLAQDANDVQAAAGAGSHFDNKNAGENKTVELYNMTLSGSKSNNYDLAQSVTVHTGTITPRTISKTAVVLLDANGNVIATPSKVYDGTTTYDIANKTLLSSSILPGDTVSFQLVGADFDNKNATNFVPPSLNGIGGLLPGAHTVYYTVTASGSDIGNYSFVNNATLGDRLNATTHYGAANDGFYTAGTITPRTVYLAIDDTRAITKPYDGDATVKEQANGAYLQFNPTTAGGSGGYVLYDGTVGADHDFVPVDLAPDSNGQLPVSLNIRANYDTKNVSRDSAGNVQSDKVVTYDISLEGDYKGNYVLANQSTGAAVSYNNGGSGSVHYTQNRGEITPLTVNTTFSGVDRVYDGMDTVYSSSVNNISQQVTWDNVLSADQGKIALNPNLALQGSYQSMGSEAAKDVYVNNGQVADKNITITSGISTAFVDNSGDYTVGNYDFVDNGTGTGKITPRPVGILELRDSNGNVVSHADSKPYDGNASYLGSLSGSYSVQAQNTGVAKGTSGDGIIQGDTFDFGFGSGQAYYANAQGQEDGNATGYNGTGTGAERVFYDVTVTALSGTNAANYTFGQAGSTDYLKSGSNYGSAASVAGTIDRRTITIGQVANSGVKKEYDGTASINGAALANGGASATDFGSMVAYAGDSANDPDKQLVTSNGAPLDVAWDFSKSAYDTENVKRDTQNNAVLTDSHNVSYVVSLTGAAAGNYVLQDVNGTPVATGANTNTSPSTLTYGATGTITPRKVDVIGTGAGNAFTKVYDGTTTVSQQQLQTGTKIVWNNDPSVNGLVQRNGVTDDVQVGMNGTLSYAKAGANADQNGTLLSGKNPIALTMSGNIELQGNDSGNYELVNTTLPTGNITQRVLYVDFVGGQDANGNKLDGTEINRTYNKIYDSVTGTYVADTSVDTPYRNIVTLVTTQSGDTGVIPGDDVSLKKNSNGDYTYKHDYIDGNVARDNSGNVTTKTVYYYGFELDGTASSNYVIQNKPNSTAPSYNGYSEVLVGKGTINPRKIGLSIDNVSKEYDGTTSVNNGGWTTIRQNITDALADAHLVNAQNTIVILPGDSINATLEKAEYQDPHVNRTNPASLGVDYTLAWDNQNYELVALPTNNNGLIASYTVPDNPAQGKVYAKFTSYNNEITPKVISKIQVKAAEKYYDGTTTVNDAAKNLDFADKIGSDDLHITATGDYDDPNAALGEDYAVPIAHAVNYAYTIGNTDYQLDNNGTMTGTTSGDGIIKRAILTVQPDNVTVANAAEARSHSYTGTVTGFQNGETYSTTGSFSYGLDSNVTVNPTTTVVGWYTNERGNRVDAGSTGAALNYGKNYKLQFNTGTITYSTPGSNPSPNPNPGPNPSPNPNPGGNTPTPQNVNPTPGGPGGGSGWGGIVPNPSPNPTPTPGGENGGTGENPGTGGNAGPGGSGTGLDGSSSDGSGVSWDALMALGGTGTGGTANGAAASTIATTSAVLAEAGSKKVTPDNTILVQVSESDGLAAAANVAETPFSSASVAYKSTGVNAADLSGTGQIVGVSSNAAVNSEIALESSAGSVSISNDSNTESTAELEHSDATVNITTQGGTKSSISLGTSEDGVNLSTGTRSDATTKTMASSSEQTETSSGISIRVQKDDKEEDTETGEENRSKKQDSSLIGLETLKDAVNLGAPMNTAV